MKIALCLSGGGFRASLFHLGVIGYFQRIGLLNSIDTVCGVSGGAIFGAHLVHNWEKYLAGGNKFDEAAAELIRFTKKDVRGRILRRLPWVFSMKLIPKFGSTRSDLLQKELQGLYGKGAEFLGSAGKENRPNLYILSTNLNIGGTWTFHPEGFYADDPDLSDEEWLSSIKDGGIEFLTTAFAVGASAAFPAFFPPFKVTKKSLGVPIRPPEQFLTDGGVFDNLGLRKIQQLKSRGEKFDLVIVSDAGAPFALEEQKRFSGPFSTAVRASDILSQRVGQLEYELVEEHERVKQHKQQKADAGDDTQHISGDLVAVRISQRIKEQGPGEPTLEMQHALQNVRTDLDRFSDTEVRWLIKFGGAIARDAMKARIGHDSASFPNVNLEAGEGNLWDPIQSGGGAGNPSEEELKKDWVHLQKSARRKWRLFDWKDPWSWINILAFTAISGLIIGVFGITVSQSRFFSLAFPFQYKVEIKYPPDLVDRFVNYYKKVDPSAVPDLQSYLEYYEKKQPRNVVKDVRTYLESYQPISEEKDHSALIETLAYYVNSEGGRGLGRAFFAIVPPCDIEQNDNPSDDCLKATGEERTTSEFNRWNGVLYYQFPNKGEYWYEKLIGRFLWRFRNTVLYFDGKIVFPENVSPRLCLNFIQRPRETQSRYEYYIGFDVEEDVYKGTLYFGAKEEAPCDLKIIDNAFELGSWRLDRRE